jgi:AraC-like DNA-binding protein
VGTAPLDRFAVIRTRDPDAMRDAIIRVYGARRFDVRGGESAFAARANHCKLQSVSISYCNYATPVALEFPGANYVRQQFCLRGAGETRFGTQSFAVNDRQSCVIPSDTRVALDFSEHYEQLVVRIDATALVEKLGALLGAPPGKPLRFEPTTDLAGAAAARLRRFLLFFVAELDASPTPPSEALLAEYQQMLMLHVLTANRHNFSDLLARPSPAAAPWQVRIVEDFIEANWSRPISIKALAAATGASARSIFKSFETSRGYSPMVYVKLVRLRSARGMLEQADGATTVTEVALRCGFQNIGRFASDYREHFGELPSATLNRARSAGRIVVAETHPAPVRRGRTATG